ncbi:PGPGW domain-containing protein [Actinomadura sp. WAC 06369]|uniref:PGPGW domain-containing protein n=1 Tax=Actinomadura sp. WAC 06369 TaxID=2203193 RepID=UPI001315AD08|nr:PGPGW domain-containing protein [Actinomadura sp. WAC 06369]
MTTTAPHRPAPETAADTPAETAAADAATAAPRGRLRPVRKIAVAVAGTVVIAAGIVMLVIPGPGVVVILAGIGLLGTEFPAAKRVSERCYGYLRTAWAKIRRKKD